MRFEDRHGHEIHKGDTVQVVYGGEHHLMKVDDLHGPPTPHGHPTLEGTIAIRIHPTSTTLAKDHKTPKPAPAYDESQKDAEHTLSPAPAIKESTQRAHDEHHKPRKDHK